MTATLTQSERELPDEWEKQPLGRLARFRTGPFGSALHKSDYTTNGVPVINPMHIIDGWLVPSNGMMVTEEAANSLADFRVRDNDILIGRRGDMGRAAVVSPHQAGWLCGTGSMIVRCAESLDPQFLRLLLSSPPVIADIESTSVGTTMVNLNQQTLSALLIQVPPLEEQRAISQALSDVDALLGALDRLIAKKRDLKQAAMQQLLTGQTRLPGFSGDWRATTLGEIGECIIGLTYSPANVVEHGLLVLRASNIQRNQLSFDDNVYVDVDVPTHLLTQSGDILICVRNGSRALIGKCALIDDKFAGLTFGAFMSVFRTRSYGFIFHVFQSHAVQRQIRDNIGATINQITNKDMRSIRVMLPSEDEQAAIVAVFSGTDAEIAALERRRDKTRLLKQGMMQELLTGRTRLV